MLRNGSKLSKEQIQRKLATWGFYICLSQVRYDLEDMKDEFDAPIEIEHQYEDGKRGTHYIYFYGDLEYSLDYRYLMKELRKAKSLF